MPTLISNKKARLNYEVLETYEAGIELHGLEVKSLKNKRGSLDGTFVSIRGGEAFLRNMHIPPYQPANAPSDYDPYRNRRLLLTKQEIAKLASQDRQKGLTIIPLSVYTTRGVIKAEVAVVRGKKKHDKREDIKRRDMERDMRREAKDVLR